MLKLGAIKENYTNALKILNEEMNSEVKYIVSFEGLYTKEYFEIVDSLVDIEKHENDKLIDTNLKCIKVRITRGTPSIIQRWFTNTKPMTMKEIVETARRQYLVKEYEFPDNIIILEIVED